MRVGMGAQFEHLKQPQISKKKDQKMIVVESKGDPEKYVTIIQYRVRKTDKE